MKRLAVLLALAPLAARAETASTLETCLRSTAHSVGAFLLFALLGILVAIVGYRLFDKFTPGDLHKEILENKNVAAAIIGGAVILGVSIIVAASIAG